MNEMLKVDNITKNRNNIYNNATFNYQKVCVDTKKVNENGLLFTKTHKENRQF